MRKFRPPPAAACQRAASTDARRSRLPSDFLSEWAGKTATDAWRGLQVSVRAGAVKPDRAAKHKAGFEKKRLSRRIINDFTAPADAEVQHGSVIAGFGKRPAISTRSDLEFIFQGDLVKVAHQGVDPHMPAPR